MNTPSSCPRCDDAGIEQVAESPVPRVWGVFRCRRCNYVWRSTEKLTDIAKYDQQVVDRAHAPWGR